jgi:hypothetical protein
MVLVELLLVTVVLTGGGEVVDHVVVVVHVRSVVVVEVGVLCEVELALDYLVVADKRYVSVDHVIQ